MLVINDTCLSLCEVGYEHDDDDDDKDDCDGGKKNKNKKAGRRDFQSNPGTCHGTIIAGRSRPGVPRPCGSAPGTCATCAEGGLGACHHGTCTRFVELASYT